MATIGVLDIGTGSVKVIIGTYSEGSAFEVSAKGEVKVKKADRGYLSKPSTFVKYIKKAVAVAEETSGTQIHDLHIVFQPPHLKSSNVTVSMKLGEEPQLIEEEHIKELFNRALEKAKEPNYEILHAIPRYFKLDGDLYYEPYDLEASEIEAEYHIIKVPVTVLRNTSKVVEKSGYIPGKKIFGTYAAAFAVFEEEDFDTDILLIDLGHTTTSFVYFEGGSPKISGVIPKGGRLLTEYIAHQYKLPFQEAERIKEEFAVAHPSLISEETGEILAKTKDGKDVVIPLSEIEALTEGFLGEILEPVFERLYKEGVNLEQAFFDTVLIGGGANIKGLPEYFRELGLPARIGTPQNVSSLMDDIFNPKYAAALGAAVYVASKEEEGDDTLLFLPEDKEENIPVPDLPIPELDEGKEEKKKGIFGRILSSLKNIFMGD